MTTPTTTLDQRYSDPGSEPTPWERTRRVIEEAPLFWVTTVRADERPHSTPLVAVWLDGALHFATGAEEQKARNLAANPHVLLTTGDDGWQDGLDVVVEGDAVRVGDHALLTRLTEAWTGKWDGRWRFEVRDDELAFEGDGPVATVFRVEPATVLAFGKGPFTHTTHRF